MVVDCRWWIVDFQQSAINNRQSTIGVVRRGTEAVVGKTAWQNQRRSPTTFSAPFAREIPLLQADRLDRAGVGACAAIAAGIGVNHGQTILHRNRFQRARLDTRLTSGAFFSVYYGCH
jgi:hypothetical protein